MIPDRFFELDDMDWSAREIAQELRVSPRTVQRWRRASGRSRGDAPVPFPVEAREFVAALVADGCSLCEAARTVGTAKKTVYRWFPDAPRWSRSEAGGFRFERKAS